MNKLYEPFDSALKSRMDKMLNDLELLDEQVRIKGLENNQIFLDWQDSINKLVTK